MTIQLTTDQVWQEIEKNLFAVLGMVTAKGEARTVGVIYAVDDRKLYIATGKITWKIKHVAHNPHVSLTIPIARQIPFLPWIKIPAATVTFSGVAKVLKHEEVKAHIIKRIYRDLMNDEAMMANSCFIEVTPQGEFITYGVGMPLMQMRFPDKARGRAAVVPSK